jgi:hypothetical protein
MLIHRSTFRLFIRLGHALKVKRLVKVLTFDYHIKRKKLSNILPLTPKTLKAACPKDRHQRFTANALVLRETHCGIYHDYQLQLAL